MLKKKKLFQSLILMAQKERPERIAKNLSSLQSTDSKKITKKRKKITKNVFLFCFLIGILVVILDGTLKRAEVLCVAFSVSGRSFEPSKSTIGFFSFRGVQIGYFRFGSSYR